MTTIEKMELLNELLELEEKNDIGNLTSSDRADFQMWVKGALEQEPILDKIRTEIDEQKKERCFDDMFEYITGLDDALYIIDKYRAEG